MLFVLIVFDLAMKKLFLRQWVRICKLHILRKGMDVCTFDFIAEDTWETLEIKILYYKDYFYMNDESSKEMLKT